MTDEIPGFPERFPVRDDGVRSWRYRLVSLTCRASLRGFFGRGLQVGSMSKIPGDGPLLIVSNHLSNIDPWIFGGFGPGVLYCLSKRELFNNPVVAWILAGCNCFPIDRGTADRRALRTALDVLSRRGRLLVFLEGTRSATPGMRRAEAGVGFLARRSGARILPVGVWGTEAALPRGRRLPKRVPIRLEIGPVFDVPARMPGERRDDQAIADLIGSRIAELLPSEYRGVYATLDRAEPTPRVGEPGEVSAPPAARGGLGAS
ncbi:MAG TPA: lysophospholipid acyltransferase family protein [Candidatus Saccharimonadales bacterium]|nr:lysophospholipid acyltransferase family protein [Candidatus Saccharimonadales bacterium]